MRPGFRLIESALQKGPNWVARPAFLVRLDPWPKVFLGNLTDLLWPRRQAPISLSSPPAPFWNDVFVKSRLPWGRFLESAVFHTAAVAVLWSSAQLWPKRPHLAPPIAFHSSDVISYELSEYLPPLNTGSPPKAMPQKGDPVYAPQPIISVPPASDNRQQTIVTPPQLKLNREVPLPNIVAWAHTAPTIPPAATAARTSDLRLPVLSASVVAPPPEVNRSRMDPAPALPASVVAPAPEVSAANARRDVAIPQPAVVAPPPGVQMAAMRNLSDINIGHAQVVAPAPQLPVDEQLALPNAARASLDNSAAAVVPPPPTIQSTSPSTPDGRLIALSVHPAAPTAPVEVPSGNRRGSFAATPEGKPGGTGTPDISPTSHGLGPVAGSKNLNGVPPGLFVGAGPKMHSASPIAGDPSGNDPKEAAADPPLVARAGSPRAIAAEMLPEQQSETERKVFGVRKSYSMTLNVPNLNSAGGSLVMHFSELKEGEKQGDLLAPVVTRAVAPGYPLELMRENVQGTVELAAVIRSDGSVADVRVLNEVDDRLEGYARDALLRWQFLPALRNGNPVPLQAVVKIPFKPRNIRF
jgi:TonB family protein